MTIFPAQTMFSKHAAAGFQIRSSAVQAESGYLRPQQSDQSGGRHTMFKTALNILAATTIAASAMTFGIADDSTAAHAADKLNTQYDLYTRGMRAFALNYSAEIDRNSFNAKAKLRPKGLASLFIDLKMDMASSGVITKKGSQSRAFSMAVREKGRERRYKVGFRGLKPVSSQRQPGVNAETEAKLAKEAAKGARDTLASIMDLAVTTAANPCDSNYRVYNGKEVFQLSLAKIKDDNFGKKDGGVYRGPAIVCSMTYSTLAGLSAKTQAKYAKNPPSFKVWFAPVESAALGRNLNVLVAVTGKLKGKKFVAYINRATINGRPFNSKSLAKK
jgi:hypothetical protein